MKKRIIGLAVTSICAAMVLVGCGSSPKSETRTTKATDFVVASETETVTKKDIKGISWDGQPSGDLQLQNDSAFDLIIFAGNISNKNILGGLKVGGKNWFDLTPFLPDDKGAVIVRAVKADVYKQKDANVTKNDIVFAKVVTYSGKRSYRITGEIGGDARVLFENHSPYPVEIRLGWDGEVVTTVAPYDNESYLYIKPNPSGKGYTFYPTYILYNKETGRMDSIAPKDNSDGLYVRPVEGNQPIPSTQILMPNAKNSGSRVAYLRIKNETGRTFDMYDFTTALRSQTGFSAVNNADTMVFEVAAEPEGTTFRNLRADFVTGSDDQRYLKFFDGEPTVLKAGVEYNIVVYIENGLGKAEIQNSSERKIDFSIRQQFSLE